MRTLRYMVRRNRIGLLGLILIIFFALMAIFPDIFARYDPVEMHPADALSPPSSQYLLGTDRFGRDILSRIAYGARVSFTVGILAVLAAALLGSFLGIFSAQPAALPGGAGDLLCNALRLAAHHTLFPAGWRAAVVCSA